MKIIHIVLSGPFTEGMTYQENLLPIQNALDGHNVLIVASCLGWDKGKIIRMTECDKIIQFGIRLIRIDYDNIINSYVSEKVRKSHKLMPIIQKFAPDIIFLHDSQVFEIINIAKYKNNHSSIKFIVDFHSDYYNSARSLLSYIFLHRFLYNALLRNAEKSIDRMYCISRSAKTFLQEVYNYRSNNIEIFPLGGFSKKHTQYERCAIRNALGYSSSDIILLHSGKINKNKKTKELLEVFNRKDYSNIKMIIIGDISMDYMNVIMPLIEQNDRVKYLGWKSGEELLEYLSISDVYIQPGSASATLQNAICAGNAVIVSQTDIYEDIVKNNGWIISDVSEIDHILEEIERSPNILVKMKRESIYIGETVLDYKILANRMYNV